MTKPLVNEQSNDLESISETRLFDSPPLLNGNKLCKENRKTLSGFSSLNYNSEYEEQCSYAMMIRNSTTGHKKFSFTPRYVAKVSQWRFVASFLFIICAVILLYQVPVILYYVAISPHIDSNDFTDYVDFRSCSVKVSRVCTFCV